MSSVEGNTTDNSVELEKETESEENCEQVGSTETESVGNSGAVVPAEHDLLAELENALQPNNSNPCASQLSVDTGGAGEPNADPELFSPEVALYDVNLVSPKPNNNEANRSASISNGICSPDRQTKTDFADLSLSNPNLDKVARLYEKYSAQCAELER